MLPLLVCEGGEWEGVQARSSPGRTRGKPSVVAERSRSAFVDVALIFAWCLTTRSATLGESSRRTQGAVSSFRAEKLFLLRAPAPLSVHKVVVNIEIFMRCAKEAVLIFFHDRSGIGDLKWKHH